jgi:serine/threonine protein kinase
MARSTLDDFVIKDKLGQGSFGCVYKVVRKQDRSIYALKEIDLHGMSRKVDRPASCFAAASAVTAHCSSSPARYTTYGSAAGWELATAGIPLLVSCANYVILQQI